jgi:putative FmdB family regulatory protein
MPIYEFKCRKCDHRFEVLRLSSGGFKNIECPKCESKDVGKEMSTFAPAMGSSSASLPCRDDSCPAPSFGGCPSGGCGLN